MDCLHCYYHKTHGGSCKLSYNSATALCRDFKKDDRGNLITRSAELLLTPNEDIPAVGKWISMPYEINGELKHLKFLSIIPVKFTEHQLECMATFQYFEEEDLRLCSTPTTK